MTEFKVTLHRTYYETVTVEAEDVTSAVGLAEGALPYGICFSCQGFGREWQRQQGPITHTEVLIIPAKWSKDA